MELSQIFIQVISEILSYFNGIYELLGFNNIILDNANSDFLNILYLGSNSLGDLLSVYTTIFIVFILHYLVYRLIKYSFIFVRGLIYDSKI